MGARKEQKDSTPTMITLRAGEKRRYCSASTSWKSSLTAISWWETWLRTWSRPFTVVSRCEYCDWGLRSCVSSTEDRGRSSSLEASERGDMIRIRLLTNTCGLGINRIQSSVCRSENFQNLSSQSASFRGHVHGVDTKEHKIFSWDRIEERAIDCKRKSWRKSTTKCITTWSVSHKKEFRIFSYHMGDRRKDKNPEGLGVGPSKQRTCYVLWGSIMPDLRALGQSDSGRTPVVLPSRVQGAEKNPYLKTLPRVHCGDKYMKKMVRIKYIENYIDIYTFMYVWFKSHAKYWPYVKLPGFRSYTSRDISNGLATDIFVTYKI